MPNINLIAARRAEKKRLEQLTRQLFFGLAASVALFILVSFYLGWQSIRMQSDLREAEQAMIRLRPKLERIDQIKDEMGILEPKVDTLQQAKLDTLRWRVVLQVISESMPADTWLTAISAGGSNDASSLRLAGFTSNQSLVGDTITRLQANPIFDKVDLNFTNLVPTSSNNTTMKVNFEVACYMRDLAPRSEENEAKPEEGGTINAEKRQSAVDKVTINTPAPERGGNNG